MKAVWKQWMRLLALAVALAMLCPAALAEAADEALEAPVGEYEAVLGEAEPPAGEDGPEAPDAEAQVEEDFAAEAEDTTITSDEVFHLDYDAVTLGKGEKLDLYPSMGGAMPVFSTSNKKYVKVNASGKVTAVKAGKATITATRDGVSDTCVVTVMNAPSKITLNYTSVTLGYDASQGLGEAFPLVYTLPAKSYSRVVTLSGYKKSVVSIDDDNVVTAVGVGSTKITAATFNDKKKSVKITVKAAPQSMAFSQAALTMAKGTTQALTLKFTGGSTGSISYTSSDTGVATVNGDGVVTAKGIGTATIEATCFNGVTAACTVEVVAAPTKISLSQTSLTLGKGDTARLVVDSDVGPLTAGLTWSTSNKSYVTVSADGLVKAVKKRSSTTTVKVKTSNGLTASAKVKVVSAPSKITLSASKLALGVGEQLRLTATLPKNTAGSYAWTTSDSTVAEVDETGNVTAIGSGSATITATTFNKKYATCSVEVSAEAAKIVLPESLVVGLNRSIPLPIEVYDVDGREYNGTAKLSFATKGIVGFQNGSLRGLKVGETVMTITAGALSATCTVTVDKDSSIGQVQSIAHRGGCGDTGQKENTLAAFKKTAGTGADGVEFDVRSTLDGVQVVHHDPTFKSGSKIYTIEKMTYVELHKVNANIPTLDEVLDLIGSTALSIHLELKETADGKKCVQAVKAHGLESRTIYFGFYVDQLKAVYKADPTAVLGYSLNASHNPVSSTWVNAYKKYHISIVVAHKDTVTAAAVQALHNQGYQVCVWTPNTKSEVEYFCDIGVDYILSNYPSYCVQYR